MEPEKKEVVFLKGSRINLRPVLESDIPLLLRWINDPEVTQYLSAYLPMMEEDEREWFNSLSSKKPYDIVLTIMVDCNPIGVIGIHNVSLKDRTATTGALIGEKDCWGKGYGTEAKMILLNYAFNTLNLRKINSSVFEFNERSYAYSIKCGYKEEGVRKQQLFRNGKYWDEILLTVFKEDWIPVWEEYKKKHKL
ncbi:MAG: GNAT family protein [Candidatus Paceibacterota bacterium]